MILPPIIRGDWRKAYPWMQTVKRLSHYLLRQSATYTNITRQPTTDITIIIKKYGQWIQPYIIAGGDVLLSGFIVTPRIGEIKIAYGDESGHNLVDHTELLAYRPATPYINDSGYRAPYDIDTGAGADFDDETEFFSQIYGYARIQWQPQYENNPALRFFAPTIGSREAFTDFSARVEFCPDKDWHGPDGVVIGWQRGGNNNIYYNGLAMWTAPGVVQAAAAKKVEATDTDPERWEIYCAVTRIESSITNIYVYKRSADARAWSARELAVLDAANALLLEDDTLPFYIYAGSYSPAREIAEAKAADDTEPSLTDVLTKVGAVDDPFLTNTGSFSYTASPGESASDIADAVSASILAASDEDLKEHILISIGAATREDGDIEYVFVYWFATRFMTDNGAWSQIGNIGSLKVEIPEIAGAFGGAVATSMTFNWRCDEFAFIADLYDNGNFNDFQGDPGSWHYGGCLMVYDLSDDDGLSIKERRLGNTALFGDFHDPSDTSTRVFRDPQYILCEYVGNTLRFASISMQHELNEIGEVVGYDQLQYNFSWRSEPLNAFNMYIEAVDIRYNKLVWTEITLTGTNVYYDNGGGDQLIYSSNVPCLDLSADRQYYFSTKAAIGSSGPGSSNSVQMATLPNGISLVSGVLSNNPVGLMRDFEDQFPTLTAITFGFTTLIISGFSYGRNISGYADVPSPESYPFSIATPPETVTINLLSTNEDPATILKLPAPASGENMTLLNIGVYGSSDGSDPMGVVDVE